jgi:hypothetical protein
MYYNIIKNFYNIIIYKMSSQNDSLETTDPFEFDFALCHDNHDCNNNVYDHSYGYCRICF